MIAGEQAAGCQLAPHGLPGAACAGMLSLCHGPAVGGLEQQSEHSSDSSLRESQAKQLQSIALPAIQASAGDEVVAPATAAAASTPCSPFAPCGPGLTITCVPPAERCIKTLRAEELYRNLRLACLSSRPGDMDDVLKDYSRAVVMTIGREVDRIEAEIR